MSHNNKTKSAPKKNINNTGNPTLKGKKENSSVKDQHLVLGGKNKNQVSDSRPRLFITNKYTYWLYIDLGF